MCRAFSRFSESFNGVLSCRWWNSRIPGNCGLRNVLLKLLDYFPCSFHTVVNLPFPCLWSTEPLNVAPSHIQSWCYHLSPVNLLTWSVPNQVLLGIPQLSQPFVAPVPTGLKCVAGMKFRITDEIQVFFFFKFFFYSFHLNSMSKGFRKLSHSVSFMFHSAPQLLLDLGMYIQYILSEK